MPLPFLLAGAAAVAGVVGIVKGSKSVSNNNEANRLNERAQDIYEEAKENLETCKSNTTEALEELGEIKLRSWDVQIGTFIEVAQKVTKIDVAGSVAVDDNHRAFIGKEELLEMHGVSLNAKEVMSRGIQSLGAGALAGIASYGGVMMFASASTGTAITALSGVAATNATLAWLGGGSLAAGGMGIAGGAAVLGGIVAGPILAVGGILMEAKSRENLSEAKSNYAKARKAAEELDTAASMLTAIEQIANQFSQAIIEMNERMTPVLTHLQQALQEAEVLRSRSITYQTRRWIYGLFDKKVPLRYENLTLEGQQLLQLAYAYAQTLKQLLETPLLNNEGALDESCIAALPNSQQFLLEDE